MTSVYEQVPAVVDMAKASSDPPASLTLTRPLEDKTVAPLESAHDARDPVAENAKRSADENDTASPDAFL
jgi:hypothetical protein